jgi:hypothetical protein
LSFVPICDSRAVNREPDKPCCARCTALLVARSYLSRRVRPWRNW